MIVAYVCVYSSTRSSKRSSIEKETRKPFALASTKAFFVLRSARKGRFPPSFRFTFIHENHPSDIIAKKCFPSLPLLSSFLRPARTRYEILFPSFSLCFPFFAFFASKRFALRRFVVACFSLSRGLIFPKQGNPRWQKHGSSSRDLSRVPFTSPFSRASLRDRDSGGFLLFSFILFSRRNEAACDDILPPSATFTGKKTRKR